MNTAVEQFASDYLLVADNDYTIYKLLTRLVDNGASVSRISDTMREQYEDTVGTVLDVLRKSGELSDFSLMLVTQLLGGWGTAPFDAVASELVSRKDEN